MNLILPASSSRQIEHGSLTESMFYIVLHMIYEEKKETLHVKPLHLMEYLDMHNIVQIYCYHSRLQETKIIVDVNQDKLNELVQWLDQAERIFCYSTIWTYGVLHKR